MSRTADTLWVVAGVVTLAAILSATQPVIEGGVGFDGQRYLSMAAQIGSGSRPHGVEPFIWRIGTPWLAAQVTAVTAWPLPQSFALVNLAANLATALLLAAWLRRHVPDDVARGCVLLMFLVQPHSPFRFSFHYPVLTDALAMLGLVAGLLAIDRLRERPTLLRALVLSSIVAVGCLVRELVIVVALAAMFVRPPRGRWSPLFRVGPLVGGVAGLAVARWWAVGEPSDYSIWATVRTFAALKTIPQLVLSVLFVLGPAAAVVVPFWRATAQAVRARPDWLLFAGVFALLAWLAGSDTERLLVFALPIGLVLIGQALAALRDARAHSALVLIVTLQLLAARVLAPIGGSASGLAGLSAYRALFTQFLSREALIAFSAVYALASLMVIVVAWRGNATASAAGPTAGGR